MTCDSYHHKAGGSPNSLGHGICPKLGRGHHQKTLWTDNHGATNSCEILYFWYILFCNSGIYVNIGKK